MLFFTIFIIVVLMCVVMDLVKLGKVPFPGILRDIVLGTLVGYVLCRIFPVVSWGRAFAGIFGAEPGTLRFMLLNNAVMTVFFGIFLTLLFTALAIGFPPYYFQVFLSSLPLSFLLSYVSGFAAAPAAVRIARFLCTKDDGD